MMKALVYVGPRAVRLFFEERLPCKGSTM